MTNTYDLNYDFKEVKTIFIEETLEEEDLLEGLVPEIYEVKIALTTHAVERMYDTENRDVEWDEVETVLLKAGEELLSLKNGQEFNIFTSDKTFAILGNAHYQDGNLVLIVHTIIRVKTKRGTYKKLVIEDVDRTIVAIL